MNKSKLVEQFKRMMKFLEMTSFEVPSGPGSYKVVRNVRDLMKKPSMMDDRDIIQISINVDEPLVVKIYTAFESHHNGSEFDKYNETVDASEGLLEFVCSYLSNAVYRKLDDQMKEEERLARDGKIRQKMVTIGLLEDL